MTVHRIALTDDLGNVSEPAGPEFPTQPLARREAIRRNSKRRSTLTWWVWLDADGKPGRPQ